MKKALITIGIAVLLVNGSANAAGTKYFYSNGSVGTGEYWPSVYIYDTPPNHTTVNMSDGRVDTMSTFDNSIFNMTGGTVYNLYSYESSTVNISDNNHSSPFAISAGDNSTINFGGTAKGWEFDVLNLATMNITGGAIDDLTTCNSGVINIYAGDILDVWGQDSTVINIFGYNLLKVSTGGAYGHGFVHGYYGNNSYFDIDFMGSDTYSHVNLIPEPATLFLLALSGLSLRKRR